MARITGKINLMNLHASVKKMSAKSGDIECLIIPIAKNNLFRGDKGIYLDLVAFDLKTPDEKGGDTHLLKQSFSKEVLEKMSDEEKRSLPILGRLHAWGERTEAESVSSAEVLDEDDDLPF